MCFRSICLFILRRGQELVVRSKLETNVFHWITSSNWSEQEAALGAHVRHTVKCEAVDK